MPRVARVIIPGVAHHIVQRGNNRQKVLEKEEDFRNYCFWINKYAPKYSVSILAYCLMNNHVHLVVIPKLEEGLSGLFRTVHMRYAQYVNHKRKTSGHLWQGRYFSCVMDGGHLFHAIRYVEQNPVRAKMVMYPWEYEWSSARWHIGMPVKRYIQVKRLPGVNGQGWKDYLMNSNEDINERIRKATCRGKAFAGEKFVEYWEKELECILRNLKPGPRPKGMR